VDQYSLDLQDDRDVEDVATHRHALPQRLIANDPALSGDPKRLPLAGDQEEDV
jgi:hypothetical protein